MITLASDFGSPYPAAMKGVILSETDAQLVDVAHDFPRGEVRTAAFWLREVLPYFTPAVHLAVVDPGVGTDRAALAVRAGDHALIGPDNGLLLPAARRIAPDEPEAFVVEESISERVDHPVGGSASVTFHGRDVFAPAAAAVHEAGVREMGELPELEPDDDVVDCRFPEATVENGRATGEVLVVDGFGNVVTNVPGSVLQDVERVAVAGRRVPVVETFAAVPEGEALATVGSHGHVELDVNDGRGDSLFGLSPGDRIALDFSPD